MLMNFPQEEVQVISQGFLRNYVKMRKIEQGESMQGMRIRKESGIRENSLNSQSSSKISNKSIKLFTKEVEREQKSCSPKKVVGALIQGEVSPSRRLEGRKWQRKNSASPIVHDLAGEGNFEVTQTPK